MAATAVLPAMNGDKALHPFFARSNEQQGTNSILSCDEQTSERETRLDSCEDDVITGKDNGRQRKPKGSLQPTIKVQKTLQDIVNSNSRSVKDEDEGVENVPSLHSNEPAPPQRRKRRRASPAKPTEDIQDDDETPNKASKKYADDSPQRSSSPQVIIPASSPLPVEASGAKIEAPKTPPKKMLRLNASGKFSSPVLMKPKEDDPATEVPKRRDRPRKSKEVEKEKHSIVVIRYGTDRDLGQKIARILQGEERVILQMKITPKKQRTPRKQHPAKPTHPFFTGKPKDPPAAPKKESPRKASAVTPGKLRRQTMSAIQGQVVPESNDAWTSALLKDRLMMKHPGAKEPAWPTSEQTHVRALDEDEAKVSKQTFSARSPQVRKLKRARRPFTQDESVLRHFASELTPDEDGELRGDGFREPHPSLRLPQRLLISGQETYQRVAPQLCTPTVDEDMDELSRACASQPSTHPALRKLKHKIHISLNAFDEGRGESLSWTQKHAPETVAEVLQSSREMTVLKEWLTSLTVTAVESTSKADSNYATRIEPKPRKKRRRKHNDMDDFLVDSDEEVHDMDELSNTDDDPLTSGDRKTTKSVVQVANEGVKLNNAVLLSGPNGCGKTAAAYAVAKELGFKVFEINPCERRGGKDVLDKVGDMTENHLVKHHGNDAGETSSTEEPHSNDEAFERDLASGRQGKLGSFFKAQARTKSASPKKKKKKQLAKPKAKAIEGLQNAIKRPAKDQQQSLILLEEIDTLFKDDKDFWTTVLKLIATSKRPFIMTCNDEDLIPVQAMSLHAILRFLPPPLDLASDYLLLIAAAEGHLLTRGAVAAMYRSNQCDIRASIAELDFWCQLGVGDPKGGLSWIYQRYPSGSDLDQHGRQLKVASRGTYQSGMGRSPPGDLNVEDQTLWTSQAFGTDAPTLLGWQDIDSQKFPTLNAYGVLAESLSAADVYSACDQDFLDSTQPPMTEKARSQYREGMELLQTDELVDYTNTRQKLAIASSLAAFRAAGLLNTNEVKQKVANSHADLRTEPVRRTRHSFACFDAISNSIDSVLSLGSGLTQSAFDGPLEPIATDLAPYVRSIVQYDIALSEQRERLSTLLGGGQNGKRGRTTRAARSALEGSQRASTRKEKWFPGNLDFEAVLATGGDDWPRPGLDFVHAGSSELAGSPTSSIESSGVDQVS